MASMDVESLFTNVPVDDTIEIICKQVYHTDGKKLAITEETLRILLRTCTKEAAFYGPDGKMYVQSDGVAMGFPLGVLFANFYMGVVEEKVFAENPDKKPAVYARYIDDIFINANTEEEVLHLIDNFKKNSCFNYTQELEEESKLPFFDVMVHRSSSSFSTVINAFVKRALTHSSSWNAAHADFKRNSQLLSNNGYPQQDIDEVIRRRMDNYIRENPPKQQTSYITLYYKNTMSSAYKEDEKAIKIIHNNVSPVNTDTKLQVIIYYKTRKTASLIMKNSCLPPTHSLQEVNVVYRHSCTVGDCSHLNSRYIGFTSTTLSKTIRAHLQDGAIRRHYMNEHGLILKRHHMESSTTILAKENDLRRLKMTEAVHIHSEKPTINIQQQPESSLPSQPQPNGAATGRSLAAPNTTRSAL
ncbi:uncharacterized protein LOC123514127 [Portunus trituberculatus]|uniref:uncharacterized protein LOC123514127 n=1 Tax=Portunus trituberculatus TaxID=210409 RepID=UPI001E1CDE51|nr:uncharacterized protein LOC123514127 [Portunus trituberculatus]